MSDESSKGTRMSGSSPQSARFFWTDDGFEVVLADDYDALVEQFDALKRQADLDAERAAILSSAVGRARLILGDASKETTALIDAALASNPAKNSDA